MKEKNIKESSEQRAALFVAVMREAEKETRMRIAVSEQDNKMYIIDDVSGERFELMTTVEKVENKRKKQVKKSKKYSSSKK